MYSNSLFKALTLAACLLSPAYAAPHSAARDWNEAILNGIRRNVPNPPAHARNLFHLAATMYDCWAAYDASAVNYMRQEKVSPLPTDVEAARAESIAYGAYAIIKARFGTTTGSFQTIPEIESLLSTQGYSLTIANGPTTSANTPAMLGKRMAEAILLWGSQDGFTNTTYPFNRPYNTDDNPNMATANIMAVMGTNGNGTQNQPLGAGIPFGTNPNFWQPLSLSSSITQNGIVQGSIQGFVGVQGLATTPFSLNRALLTRPWIDPFGGPSKLSTPTLSSPSNTAARQGVVDVIRASGQLNSQTLKDIAPSSIGNNPLGEDAGVGYATNPLTGAGYTPVYVKEGDYFRVLAEHWADGPNSETPPGHWHTIANEVSELPELEKRIGGVGPIVNDLEWDVKVYFALAGATHDAACAAWSLKRFYSGARPITQIRWMATQGQSSDPEMPNYSPYGLPLIPGVIEQITWNDVGFGGKFFRILDLMFNMEVSGSSYVGQVVVRSWPGEHPSNPPQPNIATHQSPVKWMLGRDWLPFQRKTFNTPAFPGYVSGHSTFSRAAAEVLTAITGSEYFPGGYHSTTIRANSLQIDKGPSEDVKLGWAKYYDAADQAGQSRRFGGIHVSEDDFHGRIIGSQAGKSAYQLAASYWSGGIRETPIPVTIAILPTGQCELKWKPIRGLYHRVQSSPDLTTWTDASLPIQSFGTESTWVDPDPASNQKLYFRVMASGQ
jgi:hypothetical protein